MITGASINLFREIIIIRHHSHIERHVRHRKKKSTNKLNDKKIITIKVRREPHMLLSRYGSLACACATLADQFPLFPFLPFSSLLNGCIILLVQSLELNSKEESKKETREREKNTIPLSQKVPISHNSILLLSSSTNYSSASWHKP